MARLRYKILRISFDSELKGFVYLVGLCFACFVTFMINSALGDKTQEGDKSLLCNTFSINNIYSDKTPASLIIFSYTFFYLVYPIAKHNLAIYNVPTLVVLFPLLILADIWWNFSHNCFPIVNCVITMPVAWLWIDASAPTTVLQLQVLERMMTSTEGPGRRGKAPFKDLKWIVVDAGQDWAAFEQLIRTAAARHGGLRQCLVSLGV